MSRSGVQKDSASYLIHEDVARYDPWLKFVLGGVIALTLVPGIVLLSLELPRAYVWLATTAFDALLFHIVLPRRFQIFEDRLRIVLGWPLALNFPLTTIKEARPVPGAKALFYPGVRFATSTRSAIEIARHRGLNMVISPSNRDLFLEQLGRALADAPERK
jgi:hypothetical protein